MLKKKTGIKPKPKGPPLRRNVPGESQGQTEERPSQTPGPTPAPVVSEQSASTVNITQKSATDDATVPPSQAKATSLPTAAPPLEAPVPTPPPTAPVDDGPVPTGVGISEAATAETSGQQREVTQANSDSAVAGSRLDADHALTSAGPSASDLAPAAPSQVDPVQPSEKVSAPPARSRLPAARPATAIRPLGTTSATASASITTSLLTAIQPTLPRDTAIAVPATPPDSETVTPSEAAEIGAPVDLPQQSIEATDEPDVNEPPAVPPKSKRAPRKRKGADDNSEANGEPLHAPKRTRKKPAAAENTAVAEDGNVEDGESSQTPAPIPVRPRRVRVPVVRDASEGQSTNEGSDAGSGVGVNESQPRRRGGGGRQRSMTPEDADQQKVDMRQVKMGDLVKDLKIGKKFSRHDELLERERKKKLKAKMRAAGLDPDAVQDDAATEAASATGTPDPGASGTTSGGVKKVPEAVTSAAAVAPSFQIVDGQIVLNQASLQYDRHAAAADAAGEMEEEEEDEFTHHTTQNSYRRKIQKPNHWNDLDTEQFYDALRIFGTDFETIAKMFPGKNRRHLKLKFNREERANPTRVNAALVGERMAEIDLVDFQRRAGLQLRPTDEILREETARAEALAQQERAVEEEAAAEETRKREALLSKSAKEKEDEEDARVKGRGRGRKKKQEGGFGMFG